MNHHRWTTRQRELQWDNPVIISSSLVPRLCIGWRHEIAVPEYSIAFCGWKSHRNHLLEHSQGMEALTVCTTHIHILLLSLDCRTDTCNVLEKVNVVLHPTCLLILYFLSGVQMDSGEHRVPGLPAFGKLFHHWTMLALYAHYLTDTEQLLCPTATWLINHFQ